MATGGQSLLAMASMLTSMKLVKSWGPPGEAIILREANSEHEDSKAWDSLQIG